MKKIKEFLFISMVLIANISLAQQESNKEPKATQNETKLSYNKIPNLKKAFINIAPTNKNEGLKVGVLGKNGGDKNVVIKLANDIADSKYGNYDSFLISYQGKLLFESYYKKGRINLPHFQASATKVYTSLAIGRAIELGYLTIDDLNKPLVSFLTKLDPTKLVDGVEKITLHQAMTMRSGLRFTKEQISEFRKNRKVYHGIYQAQAFLSLSKPVNSTSQGFKYQGVDPILVMQVLDAVVPGSAKDFIKNEFFDKLGIHNYKWSNDLSGLPLGDSGLKMTSRDMLKLGILVNNKGKWNGKQLISYAFMTKATSKFTKASEDWHPENFNYGYYFYQTEIKFGTRTYTANIAWGGGGQHLITVSDLDLIIAITGYDWEDVIFNQVSKKVIPAFVK